MIRRISTTVGALFAAFLIYSALIGVLARQIGRLIHVTAARPAAAATPDGCVVIFGLPVPYEVLIQAALLIIAFFAFEHFKERVCRHRRHLRDECIECGRPITSWHGRCPGCGVRIGPDAVGRFSPRGDRLS